MKPKKHLIVDKGLPIIGGNPDVARFVEKMKAEQVPNENPLPEFGDVLDSLGVPCNKAALDAMVERPVKKSGQTVVAQVVELETDIADFTRRNALKEGHENSRIYDIALVFNGRPYLIHSMCELEEALKNGDRNNSEKEIENDRPQLIHDTRELEGD